MKTTRYFERRVRIERPEIRIEWCERAVNSPVETEICENGRVKHWVFITERGYYLRVVTEPDGTLHNAFLDEGYTRKRRQK